MVSILATNLIHAILGDNDNITDLDLSWNHIRMKGGKEIALGVKDNVCLKVLNLSWNGFGDDGAKDVGTSQKINCFSKIPQQIIISSLSYRKKEQGTKFTLNNITIKNLKHSLMF